MTDMYILGFDVYRMGNASGPRLSHVRHRDITTYMSGGKLWVMAENRGLSLGSLKKLRSLFGEGHCYKFTTGTIFPLGLRIYDDGGDHYFIVPDMDMPYDHFVDLLNRLAEKCEYAGRLEEILA